MTTSSSKGQTLEINTDEVKAWCDHIDAGAKEEVEKMMYLALQKSASIVQQNEAKQVPRGVTSGLAQSLRQLVTAEAAAIGPNPSLKYAIFVEKGTKPHMPPVDAITDWANSKGINPWALAMGIKKKGIAKNQYVERTFKDSKDEVNAVWLDTVHLIRDFLGEK